MQGCQGAAPAATGLTTVPAATRCLGQRLPAWGALARPRRATCAAVRQHGQTPPQEERVSLSKYSGMMQLVPEPPPECCAAWLRSQQAWAREAVEEPVEVQGVTAKGVAWSSSVHFLGLMHSSPANPSILRDVALAMQADAIGLEGVKEHRLHMRKAAESKHLLTLLQRVMETPITGVRQAHMLLSKEELVKWELGLSSAGIGLGTEIQHFQHYSHGRLRHSEGLAAAALARTQNITLAMIDTDKDARAKYTEQNNLPEVKKAVEMASLFSHERSGIFKAWHSSETISRAFNKHAKVLVSNIRMDSMDHDAMQADMDLWPAGLREAIALCERVMCRRILGLCSGTIIGGKPRKRVLVVVGRCHARPLARQLSL